MMKKIEFDPIVMHVIDTTFRSLSLTQIVYDLKHEWLGKIFKWRLVRRAELVINHGWKDEHIPYE